MSIFDDLLKSATNFGEPGDVWFRGHADHTWRLVPWIFRKPLNNIHEQRMTNDFKMSAASIIQNTPPDDDFARWLFLMQHHGLPTRLLDWSSSALSALYFATQPPDEVDGAVFVLYPEQLNFRQTGEAEIQTPESFIAKGLIKEAFDPREVDHPLVAFRAYQSNVRIARQFGHFTIHNGYVDILENEYSRFLSVIVVPAKDKARLRTELAFFGITRTSQFSDLDSLADDIKRKYMILL